MRLAAVVAVVSSIVALVCSLAVASYRSWSEPDLQEQAVLAVPVRKLGTLQRSGAQAF